MSASIYFQSGQVVFDNNGRVAPGAKLYFYDAETTTPRNTYSDDDLTAERTHPVVADGYGRIPVIYLSYGAFDVKVTTSGGTQLFYHTNIANPAPFDDSTTFDTTTVLGTGEIFCKLTNGTRTGAVRLNGRTIGNASSSATERANADTSNLFAHLWDSLADAQAAVSGGRGSSAAEDFAANKRITLPDWRAVGPVGFDDMGNTAASLLGSAPVVTGDATTAGSILGANTHTITTGQLPSHTHGLSSGSVSAASNGAHTHALSSGSVSAASNGSHTHALSSGNVSTNNTGAHTHTQDTFSTAGAHTHTITNGSNLAQFAASATTVGAGGLQIASVNLSTTSNGDHTHTFTTTSNGNHSHTVSGTTDSDGAHTHTVSGTADSDGAHTHTVSGTSDATGSGTAHNILARSGLVTWFIKL